MRQINSDRAKRGKTAEKTSSSNKSNKVYNCEQQSKYKTQKNFHLGQSQIRIQETQLQSQIQIQSQTQLQLALHATTTVAARSFRTALCVTRFVVVVVT